MDCVFCAIVSGGAPAFVVHEDGTTLAFLDRSPASDGHTLVVPKLHAEDIWAVDEQTFVDVARATHTVGRRIQERLNPDGVTLFQANRRAGWQEVFHLHMHVVPRWDGDALVRPWGFPSSDRRPIREVAEQLGAEPRGLSPGR